jgi:hypothetical protein
VTYPEYIDICDPKFTHIKSTLLEAGKISKDWILSKFVKSNDVVVSDMEFFTENVRTWSVDPCRSRNAGSNNSNNVIATNSNVVLTKINEDPSTVNKVLTRHKRKVVVV